MNTQTLYRPMGPVELARVRELGNRRFPARLPEQPYFYPVVTLQYAEQIAREWNTRAGGVGFVAQFDVLSSFLARYQPQTVGASAVHREYWIPADELDQFNDHIVGSIRVVRRFERKAS